MYVLSSSLSPCLLPSLYLLLPLFPQRLFSLPIPSLSNIHYRAPRASLIPPPPPQIEITREIGESNIFLFGHLAEDVEDLRHAHTYGTFSIDPSLASVFAAIRSNTFGDSGRFSALCSSITDHGDYYLVSDDFASYVQTQDLVDEAYRDQEGWTRRTIESVARMGFFSSDRCIQEYAEMIWNVEPLPPS